MNARANIGQIAMDLGESDPDHTLATGPFAGAFNGVQQDPLTGELQVFAADDPEVTGQYDRKPSKGVIRTLKP